MNSFGSHNLIKCFIRKNPSLNIYLSIILCNVEVYSEPCVKSKMEFYSKRQKTINFIRKNLPLKCFAVVLIIPQHSVTYWELCHIPKIERLAKIDNGFDPLTTFSKAPHLRFWQSSRYTSMSALHKYYEDRWQIFQIFMF